nr:NADH dehydrogenase subunit 2 [Megathrips lativentris]
MFLFKDNFFLNMCQYMLIMFMLVGVNTITWLAMWMAMETMLISFIPLLIKGKFICDSYSALKYFIFQCLGSTFFILGCLDFFFFEFLILGLLMKLGFFPHHFWVIAICKHLNWSNFFLLLSIQKILPMYFLVSFFHQFMSSFFFLLFLNSFVGNLGSFNQMDLRLLLVFSSMNHMTWMLMISLMNMIYFYIYLISYILMMMLLCYYFIYSNIFYLYQLFYMTEMMIKFKTMLLSFLLFSFLGFPPFLGFFLKFMSILSFNYIYLSFWVFTLLMMNLFLSFSYLRVFFYLFTNFFRSILSFNSYKVTSFSLVYVVFIFVF